MTATTGRTHICARLWPSVAGALATAGAGRVATVPATDPEHRVTRCRGRHRIVTAVALAGLLTVGCTGGQGDATPAASASAAPGGTSEEGTIVRADLLGSIEDIEGVSWPTGSDGEPLETTGIEQPHEVMLDLGDAGTFATASQLTFLEQRAGELVSVTVQPPEELQPLDTAVDEVAAQLEEHGWVDDDLAAQFDEWRGMASEDDGSVDASPLSARVDRGAVDVFVRLVPQPEGWFWTLDLARPPATWPSS